MRKRKPEKGSIDYMREQLRLGFVRAVGGCAIQDESGAGWPCRTCFFYTMSLLGIHGEDAHALWTVQLLLRNDPNHVHGYTITTTPTPEQAAHNERARIYQEGKRNG